jgi:Rrf2 family protein
LISQTAEYALRAVVSLASSDGPLTSQAISAATQVPQDYLSKVMRTLGQKKIVRSQRGLNGGFELLKPADELTVLEVITSIDPLRRFHECPLGLHGKALCPLHRRLEDAAKAVADMFGDTTIKDLINGPKDRRPLCKPAD